MFNFSIKESLNSLRSKNYDPKINKTIENLNKYEDYQLKILSSGEGIKLNDIVRLNFIENVGFRCYNIKQERYGRLPVCRSIEKFLNEKYKESLTQTENIIDYLKSELIDWNGYDTWEEFIDSQEIGQCQTIAKFCDDIGNKNNLPIVWHFGYIHLDEPYYDAMEEEDVYRLTHHWVSINDEICEFSKGTLKNYIEWYNIYDTDPELKEYEIIR